MWIKATHLSFVFWGFFRLRKPNKTFVSRTWPVGCLLNLGEFMNDKIHFRFSGMAGILQLHSSMLVVKENSYSLPVNFPGYLFPLGILFSVELA